ncbi:NfeD family protein [Ilumatobacter sp.]|uniref:NfeD family protein n=1 Tax=Ilumatobacter sp. TaxID=1967498 RepID=UPI003B52C60F
MAAVLDLGIDLDVWPWVWLAVGVVFALVELTLLAGFFVLLPFAISAFVAALAGFYDASVELQWAIFLGGGAVLFYAFWRYARDFSDRNVMPEGVGADRLVGMTAIVVATIDPDDTDRRGRVKVVGEDWGALTDAGRPLPAGSKVRIASMNGTRVVVEPIATTEPTEPPTGPPIAPPPASPPGGADTSKWAEPGPGPSDPAESRRDP